MNKIYKVVRNRAGKWAVASELTKSSGKTQSGAIAAAIATLCIAQGVSGQTVGLPAYNPTTNDNQTGMTVVSGGADVTLNGSAAQITPGISGTSVISLANLYAGGMTTDPHANPVDPASLVINVGIKSQVITVIDPISGGNQTMAVYSNANIVDTHATSVAAQYQVTLNGPTNGQQYINARLGQVDATGGTLKVAIGTSTTPTDSADNFINLGMAKQTELFYVNGTGAAASQLLWQGTNQVDMGVVTGAVAGTAQGPVASNPMSFSTYKGTFTAFNGSSRTVTDAASLQSYNSFLIGELQAGRLAASQYDAEFGKAYTSTASSITYTNGPANPNDEAYQPLGARVVIHADGANATATIEAGKRLDVFTASNTGITITSGGMWATNGATVSNEGQLSIRRRGNDTAAAMIIQANSHGLNSGIINTGFVSGLTGAVDPAAPVAAVNTTGAVLSGAGATFTNNASGVINVAGTGGTGLLVQSGAVGSNVGTINVGINAGPLDTGTTQGRSSAAVVQANGQFTNEIGGVIYLGRQPQYASGAAAADVANNTAPLAGITVVPAGKGFNKGQITLGAQVQGSAGIVATSGNGEVENSGVIDINGAAGSTPLANYGIYVVGSTNVKNTGQINVNGVNGIGLYLFSPGTSAAETSGTITVGGAISPSGLRNYGVWSEGTGSTATVSGKVDLTEVGGIGVHARNGGKINISGAGDVRFISGSNQIGYFAYGTGSVITNGGMGTQDVSTADSTLFRVESGAGFTGGAGATFAASGQNSRAFVITGAPSTFNSGSMILNVTGQNATGVVVEGGAVGTIASGTTLSLSGANAVGGLVDGQKHDLNGVAVGTPDPATMLTNSAAVGSATAGVTGFITQNQGQLINNNGVTLTGAGSTGVLARADGRLSNAGSVQVANGTGVRVEGAGAQISNTGLIQASDGTAALHLASSANATLTGAGQLEFGGAAHGVLVGSGAQGLTATDAVIAALNPAAGSGSGIENQAEISNIQLTNTTVNVGNGNGIRTATNLNPANTVNIHVAGSGKGMAFETAAGATTSNNLTLGAGYLINVSGAGGTGILANTSGTVDNSANVTVSHAAGGPALVAGTAASTINRAALVSASTTAPVVDLSNGAGTTFTNLGTLTAADVTQTAVQGSAGADTINLSAGAVTGVIAAGNGTDQLNWIGGTLNGSIEMGAGDDTLHLQGVSLATTYHVDGGAGTDQLVLDGITHRGGSFAADDLAKGVNLGADWESIALSNGTQWTLTDNLHLGGSDVSIDASSTLFAGNGVNPVIEVPGSMTVSLTNAGRIDLTNGASGPADTLTVRGNYVSNGGQLVLDTVLNEGGVNSQSDRLVVNSTQLGNGPTTLTLNTSGSGAQTVGNGIELVQVMDRTRSPAGVFQLDRRYVAGAYEYDLYHGAIDGSDADWYLRTISDTPPSPPPPPPPGPGPQPEPQPQPTPKPTPRPETGVYLSNMEAASTLFMHTLHDRLGEPQFSDRYQSGVAPSAWIRAVGSREDGKAAGGGVNLSTDSWLVHFGGDLARWSHDGKDRWHFGLMGAYGESSTDADPAHQLYTNNHIKRTANGDVEGYGVGAYATWFGNDDKPVGPYVDTWAMYNWFDNKVKGNMLPEEKYHSRGWTVSVEGGYAFIAGDLSEQRQIMIEPQAQVAYNGYDADDHREANGTWVRDGSQDGVIARLGARLYSRSKLGDNGVQPFVEANWWYNSADYTLSFNGVEMSDDIPDSTYELKAGLQGELAKGWQMWGHIGGRWGSNDYSRYEGMIGVKKTF